jgi:DNA-binding response OmpR family regulator
MHILIVDDHEDLRTMLQVWLQAEGYEVVVAPDGGTALELLERNPVDLVVTDLCMPETDGIEMIVELKKRFAHIPIVAMSGWTSSGGVDYLQVAREIGAVRTLKKPFEPVELSKIVRELIPGTDH